MACEVIAVITVITLHPTHGAPRHVLNLHAGMPSE